MIKIHLSAEQRKELEKSRRQASGRDSEKALMKKNDRHRIQTSRKRESLTFFGCLNLMNKKIYWKKSKKSDGLAIAASACNTAFIAHMKGVHGDLKIVKAIKKGFCSFFLDTGLTRKKQFYDRIDFDVLLKDKSGDI